MTKDPSAPIHTKQRFSKAAIDYLNIALKAQRNILSLNEAVHKETDNSVLPAKPLSVSYPVDYDSFRGTGWSELETTRGGQPFRWMGRLATLMVYSDLSGGAQLIIEGTKYKRFRYLKGITVWLDDYPVKGRAKWLGLNRWQFEGEIPSVPSKNKPFHLLRIESDGQAKLAKGKDAPYGSLGVSKVKISAQQTQG